MQIKPICTSQPCIIWSWGWFQEAALILGPHNQMHCLVLEWSQSALKGLCFIPLKAREKKVYREKSLIWSSFLSSEQRYFKESHLYLAACWQRTQRHREKTQNGFQIKWRRNHLCASVGNSACDRGESEFFSFRSRLQDWLFKWLMIWWHYLPGVHCPVLAINIKCFTFFFKYIQEGSKKKKKIKKLRRLTCRN